MSNLHNPVTTCLKKKGDDDTQAGGDDDMKSDASKQQQLGSASSPHAGWVHGIASGLYNASIGSVKWVASTTYSVGSSVIGTGSNLAKKVSSKEKSKNE